MASDVELGEVKYAERSINDDIDDYIFTKAHRSHSHHHHHHHHSNTENAEDTLLVQSSRPAKGSAHKCSTKSSGNEKYLQEYDELVKSTHPAMGSREQKKLLKKSKKSERKRKGALKDGKE